MQFHSMTARPVPGSFWTDSSKNSSLAWNPKWKTHLPTFYSIELSDRFPEWRLSAAREAGLSSRSRPRPPTPARRFGQEDRASTGRAISCPPVANTSRRYFAAAPFPARVSSTSIAMRVTFPSGIGLSGPHPRAQGS